MYNVETHIPHWEWYYIAMYFYIGGISAGAYFIASLLELFGSKKHEEISRIGFTIAFWVILAAPVLLTTDLGRPERFWHLFYNIKDKALSINWQSPLSVGSWALIVYSGFAALSYLDVLVSDGRIAWAPFKKYYNRIPRKTYAVIGSAAGFFVAGYTGVLLNMTARPLWEATDPLLGSLFIASGASTGAAAIALIMSHRKIASGEGFDRLLNFDRLVMLFELGLIALIVIIAGRYFAPLLLTWYGFLFWVGTVGFGILVPLGLYRYGRAPGITPANPIMVSAVLVLVGGALLRICLVQAGQIP